MGQPRLSSVKLANRETYTKPIEAVESSQSHLLIKADKQNHYPLIDGNIFPSIQLSLSHIFRGV